MSSEHDDIPDAPYFKDWEDWARHMLCVTALNLNAWPEKYPHPHNYNSQWMNQLDSRLRSRLLGVLYSQMHLAWKYECLHNHP